jgi:hypothetical protein
MTVPHRRTAPLAAESRLYRASRNGGGKNNFSRFILQRNINRFQEK